jgi:hypothetical protein
MISIAFNPDDFDRGLALDALGLMASGSQIRVVGDMTCLDGMPVSSIFEFFLQFGYIRLLEDMQDECIGQTYGMTRKGYAFWQDGVRWWHSLPLRKKIRVRLLGRE